MDGEALKTALRSYALSLGISDLGVTTWPLPPDEQSWLSPPAVCPFTAGEGEERLTGNAVEQTQSTVVCLFSYYVPWDGPVNLPRYAWGLDYHVVVPKYLEKVGAWLQSQVPGATYEIHCDTGALADRYAAYHAGLGFFGKNRCLIHPVFGSYTAIGTLTTSVSLPPDAPLQQSCMDCGQCQTTCLGACLDEQHFQYETCKSYLTQQKGELPDWAQEIIRKSPLIFGCDQCQAVCPHNRGIPKTTIAEWQDPLPYISREELEGLSNRTFKEQLGNRSFAWRGKQVLLRNMKYIESETTE